MTQNTLPEHMSSHTVFSRVHVARSLAFCVMFCRSLFVLWFCFFWPLCCLFFIDLRILITPLYLQTLLKARNNKIDISLIKSMCV